MYSNDSHLNSSALSLADRWRAIKAALEEVAHSRGSMDAADRERQLLAEAAIVKATLVRYWTRMAQRDVSDLATPIGPP